MHGMEMRNNVYELNEIDASWLCRYSVWCNVT
jgi:hypothetical protein